ncbi:hypothetical protein SE17_11465 [Kouleothrix aurantiaca]|jgi:hypothetical protein|uniref:Uncharacterized protein n=1 Tax=Kouleothrix aurantiaca TaxID=186479 RepID=A0A0N8PSM2_9CHLR|nr:hypothetical protein SE17_11465 [Kouleothrix aurantiaca]
MSVVELDVLIDRLLPQILADRELGDGRIFTRLHLNHLWALSCLHAGECFDEEILARQVANHLPPRVLMSREVGA